MVSKQHVPFKIVMAEGFRGVGGEATEGEYYSIEEWIGYHLVKKIVFLIIK